jgi:hypothetical protein
MTRVDLAPEAHRTWILANPWFWAMTGLGAVLLGWLQVHAFDWNDGGGPLRFLLVGLGLLFTGIALTVRLRLAPPFRALALIVLGGFHTLLAVGITLAVPLSFLGVEWIAWRPGHLVLLWFIVVPMSATAASVCFTRLSRGGDTTRAEEASALLTLTAFTCFIASFAVYRPDAPHEAETFRLLFGAMTLVALVAAPLVVVPQSMRRAVVSGLILLHFGGMCTAALSAPPAPWIVSHLWFRIYRPYLDFMYLNNAYHFYAPDPGPATYLWFRLIYEDDDKQKHYHWVKIPDIGEDGKPRYPLALEYQRMLCQTERATFSETAVLYHAAEPTPVLVRRFQALPGAARAGIVQADFTAPFDPYVAVEHQCRPPTGGVKKLLASYVRHVAQTAHPERPELRFHAVRIYKVTHVLPYPPGDYLRGGDVRELEYYQPYFLGEYDKRGDLTDNGKKDPLLYWLLPNIREYGKTRAEYWIKSYALKHAADPDWITPTRKNLWLRGK